MFAKRKIDVLNGPMVPNIIRYILPLIASSFLQHFYTAADNAVVGKFDSSVALAAVGSTGSLATLILNISTGLAVGASVATAQCYGAKDSEGVHKTLHTSVFLSIICGMVVAIVGFFFSHQFLVWMGSPADVLPLATLYLKIYFLGSPATLIYSFCAAVLRSVGDTQRPMYFLTISGILNVILNLIFVIFFHMSVAGVALATLISKLVAMYMIIAYMTKLQDCYRLELKKLKIYKDKLFRILRVGLPAGIQGSVFSLSNVVIQSAVNSFDNAFVMAGSTAATQVENFIYLAMNSVYHAALTFTGQNLGAGRFEKVRKVLINCLLIVTCIGLFMSTVIMLAARPLLSIYVNDSASVVEYALQKMQIVATFYVLCGIMEVFTGCLRGMGASFVPMIISMIGACGTRILWIYAVFYNFPTLTNLYLAYPISWVITILAFLVFYCIKYRKLSRQYAQRQAEVLS